jgi:hypothetical protein
MLIFLSKAPDDGHELGDITNTHAANYVLYVTYIPKQHTVVSAEHCVYFSGINSSLGFIPLK